MTFVVGCLNDVCRGLAGALVMKCTCAGPKTGNNEDVYLVRRIVFPEIGLVIHGDPKHAATTQSDWNGDVQVGDLMPRCRHEVA